MSTLWNKGRMADAMVERFTVGMDRILDLRLARFDIKGSIAHIEMLESISLLTKNEFELLSKELNLILQDVEEERFVLEEDVEDIHSQIELLLIRRIGDIGKKIHSGRSRNDQVLTDIKLYLKWEIRKIKDEVSNLFAQLQMLSEREKDVMMPGYTHTQIAMPSSFGLWFGAYAETLVDDLYILASAWKIADQNPLGSAAGYGSSFPLNRDITTKLLGFSTMNYNSVAAQMSRGKSEKALSCAIAAIASTINKLATDCISFMNGNYGFIFFPDELTTGSSIMPHKKNPDVWEIIRGKCNRIESVPNEISLIATNMSNGYHRDFQLFKDILFPALDSFHEIMDMTMLMLDGIKVNRNILDDPRYDYLFTVEEVNRRVLAGVPFRDAYKQVGMEVDEDIFKAEKMVNHIHKGSIGNLATEEIRYKFEKSLLLFD